LRSRPHAGGHVAVERAQAFAEGLTIVTRDKRFDDYGVPLLAA